MIFNIDDSKEEIIRKINASQGVTETIHVGIAYLNFKLQADLLERQSKFNEQQLSQSRKLVYATWALVLATLCLVKFG